MITVPYLAAHLSARRGIWFRRELLLLLPGAQLLASKLQSWIILKMKKTAQGSQPQQISAPAPQARLNWLDHFLLPKVIRRQMRLVCEQEKDFARLCWKAVIQ